MATLNEKEPTVPEDTSTETVQNESTAGAEPKKQPKVDWSDPAVPAGDAPPMPRWPLIVAALAWGGWVVFLIVMMVMRLKSAPA